MPPSSRGTLGSTPTTPRRRAATPLEPVGALGFPGTLEGRVALVELLPVLVFDMGVQVEDTLDQGVKEGVYVFARVDHRLLYFHLVH
jgi:hypothetical protein